MNRTAFVTGGTGFIGTNLIQLLVAEGWHVTALYREQSDRSPFDELPVTWVKGSVTDVESLRSNLPGNTPVVFHLAGDTNMWSRQNNRQTAINVKGTANMVRAAAEKDVSAFIHTSSIAAWGDVSGTVTEETTQRGEVSWINYERTKWAGEQEALKGLGHGMKVVILNPANVIGPHDANNWGRLFLALNDNELPFIADGRVSIAHVKKIARAHLAAVEKSAAGERYILAGQNCFFSDFIKTIADVSGIDNLPKVVPTALFRGYARLLSWGSLVSGTEPTVTPELAKLMTRQNVSYSSKKAIRELGYEIPPLEESVRDCYAWLKAEGLL